MKKKAIAILLATVMTAMSLTGCGEKNDTPATASSSATESKTSEASSQASEETKEETGITFPLAEKMEFTGFAQMNGENKLSEALAFKTSLERANIEIKLTEVMKSEAKEKSGLILSGGEYPEVFIKSGVDGFQYGTEGIFIPLEDMIKEYAPNLCAILDERNLWGDLTEGDGHIYSLPQFEKPSPAPANPLWINKAWMDRLGLKEPKSFDELYEVLKAFKEQDANGNGDANDEIPFICSSDLFTPIYFLEYSDYCMDYKTYCAVKDNDLIYVPADEGFKEYLAFVEKLYAEGLLHENSFTQTYEQLTAITKSGDVAGGTFRSTSAIFAGPENALNYIILTPWNDNYPVGTGMTKNGLSITDACEHPEVIVAWADYFYSEEGGTLAIMGVEGETYQWNADGTWDWIVGKGYGDDVATVRAKNSMQGSEVCPYLNPDNWTKMNPKNDPASSWFWSERDRVTPMGRVPMPVLNYTDAENAEISTLETQLKDYVNEYTAQVATGLVDLDSTFEEYLNTLKAMGLEDMLAIRKAAYERAISK